MNFRRRKAMKLKIRIFRVKCRKKFFVPFDIKIGMKTALHQNSGSAKRDRFINSRTDLFDRMNVCFRFSRSTIKRAKCADDIADICVINVPVDDVSYYVFWVFARTNFIRGNDADSGKISRFKSAVTSSDEIRSPLKALSKIG